jgi:hypothetical protein
MEIPAPRRLPLFSRVVAIAFLGTLAAAPACRKTDVPPPGAQPAPAATESPLTTPHIDLGSLTTRIGVKPGPLSHPGVGPAASIMSASGVVQVRRVGEDRFVESQENTPLYAGDQVWTTPHAQATVAFADDTLVQLADETAISIGNRAVSPDPASSVAVLYGVTRLSISPRARGEGAFLTSAGPALIGAKGTVFSVAVVAGGLVRVGVEHGEVAVAGPAALDKPVALQTAEAVLVDLKGVAGKVEAFKVDDWGDWRFAIESSGDVAAVAKVHADRLVGTVSRLDANYQVLQSLGTTASTLTWQAEANAKRKGPGVAEYKSSAVERAASIEAMYRLSVEISRLTGAALSDAFILTELYRRHPKEVEPQFTEFTYEIAAALLNNKKLQVVSEVFLEPLRPAYYAHTARGRARAASIDMPPGIFAQIKLAEVPASELAKRLPAGLYVPPQLESATRPHPLWQRAPRVGWDERLTLQPVPPRQGSWYMPPTRAEGHLIAGVDAQGSLPPVFASGAPTEPGKTELGFLIPPLPPMGPDAGQ